MNKGIKYGSSMGMGMGTGEAEATSFPAARIAGTAAVVGITFAAIGVGEKLVMRALGSKEVPEIDLDVSIDPETLTGKVRIREAEDEKDEKKDKKAEKDEKKAEKDEKKDKKAA